MRTRGAIQITLGLLWLLDGALQLQPFMFTHSFADTVITPAAEGQPAFVAGPVHFAARLIHTSPAGFNTLFALTQLAIGAGLLIARTARYALAASIAWAISVWWLGEGLGALAAGHAQMLTGAPGAVILYALAALTAYPAKTARSERAANRAPTHEGYRSDIAPPAWIIPIWALLWLTGAVLQLLPGNALPTALTQAAATAPDYLAGPARATAQATGHAAATITVAVVQSAIGLSALTPRTRRPAAYAGIIVSLAYWVFGQGLGQLSTGQATDPGTAPLTILLAGILLGTTRTQSAAGMHPREPLSAQYQPNRPA